MKKCKIFIHCIVTNPIIALLCFIPVFIILGIIFCVNIGYAIQNTPLNFIDEETEHGDRVKLCADRLDWETIYACGLLGFLWTITSLVSIFVIAILICLTILVIIGLYYIIAWCKNAWNRSTITVNGYSTPLDLDLFIDADDKYMYKYTQI